MTEHKKKSTTKPNIFAFRLEAEPSKDFMSICRNRNQRPSALIRQVISNFVRQSEG
jgi:hypothetical protein